MEIKTMEFILRSINEVGFPIIAFFVMAYMCFVTIEANTAALDNLRIAIELSN